MVARGVILAQPLLLSRLPLRSLSIPPLHENPPNQVCRDSRPGDDFFFCYSSYQGTGPQVVAGRVLASEENVANAVPNAPPRYAVIFGEAHEAAGRPAVDSDRINGAEARALTVSDWVGLYGDCVGDKIWVWVIDGEHEGAE